MGVLKAAPFQAPSPRPASADRGSAQGEPTGGPPADRIREKSAAALAAAELAASGVVDPRQDKTLPFEPVSEPLYPKNVEEAGDQAPRWRGG